MYSWKRVALVALAAIAGVFTLGVLLAYFYQDQVKAYVVQSLNRNLTAKIEVQDISFSFLRNFPYAAIEFRNLKAGEARGFVSTGTVLNAGSLSLLFNLTGIFSDRYQLKKIVLKDASLNLQVAEDGTTNYQIWKTDTSQNGNFQLQLQQVEFSNVSVLYYNAVKVHDISFLIQSGLLEGDFSKDNYRLTTTGELDDASVKIDQVYYLRGKYCGIRLTLDVDRGEGKYVFRESKMDLEGLTLQLDGNITDPGDYLHLDLAVSSPGADLPSLLALIPSGYTTAVTDYNYSGKVEFSGTIKGRSDAKHAPLVEFKFASRDVFLNPKNTPYQLSHLNGRGYFTNRKNKANPVEYLKLENFSATLEGKPVRADVEIENFKKPRLHISASIEADLKAMSRFFKPDTLEDISGNIVVDASFNGISGEKSTYRSSGNIGFSGVAFRLKQKPVSFSGIQGMIHLNGNDVDVESLSGTAGQSDFEITGSFRNLFAWLFSDNQSLDVNARVASKLVNLDELLAKDHRASATAPDTVYRLNFPERLRFVLDADINRLRFRKFEASAIQGTVALENKVLVTRALDFNTAGGSVMLKGSIDDRPSDSLRIEYDAVVNDVDINKLFTEMGNFGQSTLVDKNLKGRVTAEILFRSVWTDRLEVNENSIYSRSHITIQNGELISFKPMLALDKYLKGADLKTVKFSTLSNTIEIKNRIIYIPLMEIKSSAIDITASGEHTFDNRVDYKLRLYLSQIMGRKIRQQHTEFGTIEDDGVGRPMIFLTMKGQASDPKFTWDRKGVEKKITDEVRKETRSLKSLFREEFGRKTEDPKDPVKPRKTEELQIDYEEDSDP